MKLLIFGASGPTGQQLTRQALGRGHRVTAFVRRPARFPLVHPHLRVVAGDIGDSRAVAQAVPGHEAVLSALGTKVLRANTIVSDGVRHLLAALQAPGSPRRLVFLSSLGIGSSRGQLGRFYNWVLIPFMLKHLFRDKEVQEDLIRRSALAWTLVRPAALTNGPAAGRYTAGFTEPTGLKVRISRADVAAFMLDAVEQDEYVQQIIALSD